MKFSLIYHNIYKIYTNTIKIHSHISYNIIQHIYTYTNNIIQHVYTYTNNIIQHV